jgi:hypothetical protein
MVKALSKLAKPGKMTLAGALAVAWVTCTPEVRLSRNC